MKSDTIRVIDGMVAVCPHGRHKERAYHFGLIDWKNMLQRAIATAVPTTSLLCVVAMMTGCNADAWMGDPNSAGYYKPTPTTIPILDRIDIIEEPMDWPEISKVTASDLMPGDLTYRIAPSDVVIVEVYGLYNPQQITTVTRRVDQSGYFRVPEIGDVLAAGLTQQEFQDRLVSEFGKVLMTNPSVQVSMADSTAFTYTLYGGLQRWGVFTLLDPNLRLLDALALAGGVPQTTKKIYVIRELPLSDDVLPTWDRDNVKIDGLTAGSSSNGGVAQPPPSNTQETPATEVNIEELIKQLDIGDAPTPMEFTPVPEEPNEAVDQTQTEQHVDTPMDDAVESAEPQPEPAVSPGILQSSNEELIDIDELVPTPATTRPPVDIDQLMDATVGEPTGAPAFIYVQERDEWIPVDIGTKDTKRGSSRLPSSPKTTDSPEVILERIISIPWDRLKRGDSSYNIVIRPSDRVYVEPPPIGNVYLHGAVLRPGVFQVPVTGDLTLARLIAAAGGLSPIAKPEKVSLTRRLGGNIEATVTLNLAAIMQKTEPDIFLRPDDLISVGTDWGSTPLAIIRNGFRATYGFGFLLDRNFGNDVFGAPPRSTF